MFTKRLLWLIYIPMLLILAALMAGALWHTSYSLHDFHVSQVEKDLKVRAALLRAQITGHYLNGDYAKITALCNALTKLAEARITVILPTGKVIYDSDEDPAVMDNHAGRAEILTASSGSFGKSIRYSNTVKRNMIYVALPIVQPGEPSTSAAGTYGVLRLSVPLSSVDVTLSRINTQIVIGALILAFIAALVTLTVSRKFTRPLEIIGKAAEKYAQGDLHSTIQFEKTGAVSQEVIDLADIFNSMARQLTERIKTITKQNAELEGIFAGMAEGVLVIDMSLTCVKANEAAAFLLDQHLDNLQSGKLDDNTGNRHLVDFVNKMFSGKKQLSEIMVLSKEDHELYLQLHGAILAGETGETTGGIIVLHDISPLMQLENMRRDFVANVSHELKTPITTIRGFAETLADGEYENSENALRFVTIILKHADRLNAIVEDILTLSETEQAGEQVELPDEPVSMKEILASAIEACMVKAQEKNITIKLQCDDSVTGRVNQDLLERAVANLVVNAVKYSEDDSEVLVAAKTLENTILITVTDFGVGIGQEHIPRLFERFYRSDKARSRKLGGTGLGLAIVKHIVNAHNGQVEVESALGKGSTFTLVLPDSPALK